MSDPGQSYAMIGQFAFKGRAFSFRKAADIVRHNHSGAMDYFGNCML